MSATKPRRRVPERGVRIAQARKAAGLSQQALADRVGAGRVTIARIEAGTQRPALDLALAIGRELGESVEELFGGGR